MDKTREAPIAKAVFAGLMRFGAGQAVYQALKIAMNGQNYLRRIYGF